VKKSCEDFPFSPMMDFRYTERLPKKLERKLLRLKEKNGWDDAKYQEMVNKQFTYSLHGLKRCRNCHLYFNRDRVAAQNIGQKAVDLCLYGKVRSPFDRELYQTCLQKQQDRTKQRKEKVNKKRKREADTEDSNNSCPPVCEFVRRSSSKVKPETKHISSISNKSKKSKRQCSEDEPVFVSDVDCFYLE
jgi:hypothetical protein